MDDVTRVNTSVTRRGALGAIAAATAAVTDAGARPADAAPAIDPIYEVIEAHRKACIDYHEAVDIHMDAAYDRLDDAGCDLINTKPTTLAGILALCRYITPLFEEEDSPDLPTYILYDDDTTATPAEALCYVIGRAVEDLMKAAQS